MHTPSFLFLNRFRNSTCKLFLERVLKEIRPFKHNHSVLWQQRIDNQINRPAFLYNYRCMHLLLFYCDFSTTQPKRLLRRTDIFSSFFFSRTPRFPLYYNTLMTRILYCVHATCCIYTCFFPYYSSSLTERISRRLPLQLQRVRLWLRV